LDKQPSGPGVHRTALNPTVRSYGAGKPSQGISATAIGTVTLVFAALGVVVQLKEALNMVWR
jgi:hypothetical protein